MRQNVVVRYGTTLGLALVALACTATAQTTILPTFTFPASQAAGDTPAGLAFDGTDYWSVSGGFATDLNESEYTSDGALLADFGPGLDFRSVFSPGPNQIFARTFESPAIYQQTAPGVFTKVVRLNGGSLDSQSAVVLDFQASGAEFIAQSGGTVTRWDARGQLIGTVSLIGYGTVHNENNYPQNRGIAAHGGHWFTYSDGLLSVWSTAGVRLFNAILSQAGSSFNSNFSYSYANGMFFVGDGITWRGYAVPSE